MHTYTWTELRGRHYALLNADGGEAGRVTIEGLCGTAALAEVDGQRWRFKRSGVIRQVLTVRRSSESVPMFVSPLTMRGKCEIALGDRRYRWTSMELSGEYAWLGDDGVPLVYFQRRYGREEQYVDAVSGLPPEIETLLALLGGFLKVLSSHDTAAAVLAAIIGAG